MVILFDIGHAAVGNDCGWQGHQIVSVLSIVSYIVWTDSIGVYACSRAAVAQRKSSCQAEPLIGDNGSVIGRELQGDHPINAANWPGRGFVNLRLGMVDLDER